MNCDVKQHILQESAQLMFSYGIKTMTMDELAKRIGVSKRTIYEQFEDKDALLTAVLRHYKQEQRKRLNKNLKESPTVIHLFSQFLSHLESATFLRIVQLRDEIKRYHPAVYQKEFCNSQNKEFGELKNLFQLGIEQGVFRQNLNVDIAATLYQASMQHLFDNENKVLQRYSLEKMFEAYLHIFVRGCCTSKGLQIVDKIHKSKIKNSI